MNHPTSHKDLSKNVWSGGQYSIYRILLGGYLFIHFIHLLPWSMELFSNSGMITNGDLSPLFQFIPNLFYLSELPLFVMATVLSAAVASVFFALGYKDKFAAFWIWLVLASLFIRNPLIANPALPYLGWMLIAHLFIPTAPYGSLAARGRSNPTGNWVMPTSIIFAAWAVLAITYTYSGYTKLLSPSWVTGDTLSIVLNNPLARDYFLRDWFLAMPDFVLQGITQFILWVEYLFLPLILIPALRKPLWEAMFVVQLGFLFLLNFPDLTFVMLLFHLLTFDPAWVKPKASHKKATLFYDGHCGLCHRVVRFVIAEDQQKKFTFSPLQGQHFEDRVDESVRKRLPDSFVVLTYDNQLLVEGQAVIYICDSLGGLWKIGGNLLKLFPTSFLNKLYHLVGNNRYKLVAKTEDTCPIIGPELGTRFC